MPQRRDAPRGTLTLVAALSLALASAAGASVSLDGGFGKRGVATLGSGQVLGVAARSDGSVVAVGQRGANMLVEHLRANGRGGTSFNAGRGVAQAVVLQPDGKIVVAGTSAGAGLTQPGDMVVERFNANGSRDRKFGSGGVAHVKKGGRGNAVALGPGGQIIVAGSVPGPDVTPRVALARLRPSGAVDPSFGNHGFQEIDLGSYSEANGVAVQRDGKIVFCGDQSPGLQVVNALIGRVSAHGGLDPSFAHRGVFTYFHPHGGGASSYASVALDGRGRIVAAGADYQNSGQHALFTRLSSRGGADGGFGAGGTLTTPSAQNLGSGSNIGVRSIALTRGGEIFGAGTFMTGLTATPVVWAVTSRGRLDGGQGTGGLVKATLPGQPGGELQAVGLGPKGSLFAGGRTVAGFSSAQSQALVLRLRLRGVR